MEYNEVDGDLIALAQEGTFDVIVHGCNCFCTQKSGIAPQMVKAFDTNMYDLENISFKGDINKLGNIEYHTRFSINNQENITKFHVVNAYTQYDYRGERPINYNALIMCLIKINYIFKEKHIGLPKIGCGLAGGDWDFVKALIKIYLSDCKVTVINYKK